MRHICKRTASLVMALVMMFSLIPNVGAVESVYEDTGNDAYFDLDATEYEFREDGGDQKIIIRRTGNLGVAVDVAFKAADFLSSYGEDYVILDPKGRTLEKVDGVKPDVSELAPESDDMEADAAQPEAEASTESAETMEADAAELAADAAAYGPVYQAKKAYSTGSPLRDAAYAYLDIDGEQVELQSAEIDEEKRQIEQILTETNAYFQSAEGAEGIAHFARGETEKAITIRPIDNDEPSGTRLFLFALMGVREGQRGLIAPDANTYVSLIDDEEREAPRYELVSKDITLTEDNPEATVTVRRTSGLKDFTMAYLSTVEPATNAAPRYEYQQFNGRSVQFLPGETEKEITVKALYFDRSGRFGLRLEAADENAVLDNYSMDVTIQATEPDAELQALPDEPDAELQSVEYVAPVSDVYDEDPRAELKSNWSGAELFAAEKELPSLGLNGTASDSISVGAGEIALFKFTPAVSGYFTFWSNNAYADDAYGYLYNANKSELAHDDDSAGSRNFRINYNLTAGTTYYLGVKFYSSSKSGTISISVQAPTATQGPIGRAIVAPDGMWNGSFSSGVWGTEKTGSDSDNYSTISSNAIWVAQYDSGEHSSGYTKQPYDMTGVYQLSFHSCVHDDDYDDNDFTTYFETDTDQTWPGSINSKTIKGPYSKGDTYLSVANQNRALYIKWGVKADSGGGDNPVGWLENVSFQYTLYKLNAMTSPTAFQRNVYDYSELNNGQPKTYFTYWDNPNTQAYVPGVNLNGTTGFYTNNTGTVYITPDPQAAANGLNFAGVWLCKSGSLNSSPTSDCYYIAARNGMVSFQNTPDFVRKLISANVINSTNQTEENIYVYPKYERKLVTVTFENKDATFNNRGGHVYDADHQASHFRNIIEVWRKSGSKTSESGQGVIWKASDSGNNDVYRVKLPYMSVIRLKVDEDPSAVPNGIRYRTSYNGGVTVTYYKQGETKYSSAQGNAIITADDITMADIPLNSDELIVTPNTNEQSFYVGYSPKSYSIFKKTILKEMGVPNLAGVVRSGTIAGSDAPAEEPFTSESVNYTHHGIYDATYYRNKYSDLKNLNDSQLQTHWLNTGIREGRQASPAFDVKWFVENNLDVREEVGSDYKKAIEYFFTTGAAQGLQTSSEFNVRYYWSNYEDLRSAFGSNALRYLQHYVEYGAAEGRVAYRRRAGSSGTQVSGADGSMWLEGASTGQAYTVTALSPDGYYTSWGNLSGDTNNDGKIDKSGKTDAYTPRSDAGKSDNPQYVYGDVLNARLDIDNMRYYYKFVKTYLYDEDEMEPKTGYVRREKNTFLRLTKNEGPIGEAEPVAGANVSVAGVYAVTDGNGRYSVRIPVTEDWGALSFSVSADGSNYYGQVYIEDEEGTTLLPAFEQFNAKAASISYRNRTTSINSGGSKVTAAIEDDIMTITAQVTTKNSIRPVAARFFIYDKNGAIRVDCSQDTTNYRTTFDAGSNTAKLVFNPKLHMQAKDTVWVQFQDSGGKWYAPINMGYTFVDAVSMNNFSLESIGGKTMEGSESTGETIELIGDPLGTLNLGLLKNLNQSKETSEYVPEGLSEEEQDEYVHHLTEFKFGFAPNISMRSKWKNGEKVSRADMIKEANEGGNAYLPDPDDQETISDLSDLGKAIFGATQEDGTRKRELPSMDEPEGGGYATESKFNWSVKPQVGFKLTLSTRGDDTTVNVEDVLIYLAVDAGIGAEYAVGLPLGFQLVVRLNLSGRIAGVYNMYNEYDKTDLTMSTSGSTFNQDDMGLYGSPKTITNHTRHEGYLFFDLNLEIGLGIKWTIFYVGGKATFGFDFDFKFDEEGSHAYGQFNYNFGVVVEIAGFEVWSKETDFDGVELFSKDADGPIDFDYAGELESARLKAVQMLSEGGSYAIDRTVDRGYLQNRTAWHGQPTMWEKFASLFSAAPSDNGESVLQNGTANNPQMSLTKINDNELLMVFVGDVPTRTAENSRAVFYAIGDGRTWGNPQILDDDGTVDDYPSVCDLGDGRLLVVWSSGDKVLPEGSTLEDSLKNLDLKAAFFDKDSKTFGEAVQLTHSTSEDYTADVMPHAAYDAETDRLLLTYTKTEYDNLENQENLGRAFSVIAYLFYENGAWQNTGDAYSADELSVIASGQADPDAFKEYYKEQWYGQRFLDVRVNRSEGADLLRVIESDAACYNGLALNAWTIDWDGSLETTTDRDVFLQIYNFSEQTFTHIIRVTEKTGQHALPRFARSDSNTYLFYGAQDFDEESGNLKENGEIRYLNISDAIRNERYTLKETANSSYYELKYQTRERTAEGPDGNSTIPAEDVWYPANVAAQCDNITDYTVFVDGGGQMYLFFSDTNEESHSRLIRASMYLGKDDEAAESDGEVYDWSVPVFLTDGDSVCYAGIGGVALDGVIYLASGKSNYNDKTDTSLVLVRHTPFAEMSIDSVDASDAYPLPNGKTALTAIVRNVGLLAWTEPFDVTFGVTAKDKDGNVLETTQVTARHESAVIGGAEADVTAYVDIPEAFDTLTFTASYNGKSVECERESGSFLNIREEEIGVRLTEAGDSQQYATGTVTNNGNKTSGLISVSAYVSPDGYLNGVVLPSLAPGESASFDFALKISDSAYEIGDDGLGIATLLVTVDELEEDSVRLLDSGDELTDPSQISDADGAEVTSFTGTAQKLFDGEAIRLLKNVTIPANITFTVHEDEEGPLQPTLGGANGDQLRVDWLSTSDPSVLTIDATNAILPHTAGTVTLTGIVTPRRTNFVYDADGISSRQDWRDVIPEDLQKTVTAEVAVLAAEEEPTVTPTPTAQPTGTAQPSVTPSVAPTGAPGTPTPAPASGGGSKQGCYVATSVYGSYDCPEVWTLRRFRDEVLAETWYGRLFIHAYYAVSPTAVKIFGNTELFQNFFRGRLDKMVSDLRARGFASTPYNDPRW